jgi:pimeloyl-ACP methyl ester carboxylesterase
MPQPTEAVRILAKDLGTVMVRATTATTRAGTFGLWSRRSDGHVILGDIVNQAEETVERSVVQTFGEPLVENEMAEFRRDLYRNPGEVGLEYTEIAISTPLGPAPAWVVPGKIRAPWVIHLHGIRTERRAVLPSVGIASRLGLTSLVPSWRGDGEGPAVKGGAATLGQDEAVDVAAGVDYALAHGAPSVILLGWSMGGTIALKLADDVRYASAVAALVLVAPASSWHDIIAHGVKSAGLPGALSSGISGILSSSFGSRLVGTPGRIDVRALNWTGPGAVSTPTFVVHNPGDQLVPFVLSQQLEVNNTTVHLEVFDHAPHAMEANVSPQRFSATLSGWLENIARSGAGDE